MVLIATNAWATSLFKVKHTKDQAKLAKIAMEDENSSVRLAAMAKLTNQELLAEIAIKDTWQEQGQWIEIRKAAITNLTDHRLILDVASKTRDPDGDIQEMALSKITDQALLATMALNQKAVFRGRRTAISRLADQTTLAKLAAEDKDEWIRLAAVERLTNQTLLAKYALEDGASHIRKAAVETLSDQAMLTRIAFTEKANDVAVAAIKKIADTDQATLAKMVMHAKSLEARDFAWAKLNDPSALVQVAMEAGYEVDVSVEIRYGGASHFCKSVGELATRRITDQATLASIAIGAKTFYSQNAAVQRLSEKELLAKVAIECEDHNVCETALGKLTHLDLSAMASSASNESVKRNADMILTALAACDHNHIPEEIKLAVSVDVLAVIRALKDPMVASVVGDFRSIEDKWELIEQQYQGNGRASHSGESSAITVVLSNSFARYSRTWKTQFPTKATGQSNKRTSSVSALTNDCFSREFAGRRANGLSLNSTAAGLLPTLVPFVLPS